MNCNAIDYVSHLEDEIGLEGLDGITVESLWVRLAERHNFTNMLTLDDMSKNFLWSLIVQDEEIDFFCLPKPRNVLKIFNRYEFIDPEMALVLEPAEDIEDIYPCCPVEDDALGIKGSCSTYKTRVNVTDHVITLSLKEAFDIYDHKLVMVGSQELRNKVLCINAAIDKLYDLTLMQYVMLERIGRSRTMGEITNGKNSLAVMKINAKTMFYYRKRLLKINLITKQSHRQRTVKGTVSSSSLLHLTRFYVSRRPKCIMIIQNVIEILKSKLNYIYPLVKVKEEIGMQEIASKKLFKNAEFLRHIQTVMVPHRQIYPNATEKEWKCKAKNEEKHIRCFQLINPNIDPEDILQDDDDDEDPDEDDASSGILDQSNFYYGESLLRQAYILVVAAGPEGLSQLELSKLLGQTKLDSRCICRSLEKRKVIHSLMKDSGRQRVSRYVSNKFASSGHLLKEFETERKIMFEMVQESKTSQIEEGNDVIHYPPSTPSTSRVMESEAVEHLEIGLVMTHSGSKTSATVSEERREGGTDSPKDGDGGVIVIAPKQSVVEEGPAPCSLSKSDLSEEEKSAYIHQKKLASRLTTRMMRRANIIMKAVRKQRVVDDAFKLQKLIVDSELQEGSDAKMDKKSVARLLDRLSRMGFLKTVVVKIEAMSKLKVITFVVDSTVGLESSLLKAAIEQQKHKFLVQVSAAKKDSTVPQEQNSEGALLSTSPDSVSAKSPAKMKGDRSVGESMLELKMMHNVASAPASSVTCSDSSVEVKNVGIKGNVGPKFVRMQEFHKLMFYLVYGYEGQIDLNQEQSWNFICENSKQNLSEENWSEYPTLYLPEISWKMFIPPLPRHENYSANGWVFVVDLLLRLPLCIFVQIVNIVTQSRLLVAYLDHPVKQNLLVKSLPPELRKILLNKRRYVTYVLDLCRRLCYVGLLQQGHQLMKEKDQLFVYVNRKANLVDTTISKPGYHHISIDKEYVRKEYTFYSIQDVIQYWFDMWTICMHTPLGAHTCVEGKKITIQMLCKKPEMIETTRPRTMQEALDMDDGRIPGDERGAAGLDSAMFAHLKRNWSSVSARFTAIPESQSFNDAGEGSKPSSSDRMFSYAQYLRNSCKPSQVESSLNKNRVAGLRNVRLSLFKPKREGEESSPIAVSVGIVNARKTRKRPNGDSESILKAKPLKRRKVCYQREMKPRRKIPRKPYYDEEDKAALRRMNKLRVDWYPAEDSLLLLCKVSTAYLFPNKRTQIINFSVIRDLLHSRYPESRNKTSRACQRRINYILKNPATEENVAIILEELKQDVEITRKYKPAKLCQKIPVLTKLYANVFKDLVNRLVAKYSSNESKNVPNLPDSYEEFERNFRIIRASNSLKQGPKLEEITKTSDIDHYVINALIFSSLCTKQDRESWAYQLYLAYQKYPQNLLNSVLSSIRESKMISYKKYYNRSKYTRTCLPLSTSPFQLSLTFIYMFHMKYQYEIFGDCWNLAKKLLESKKEILPTLAMDQSKVKTVPSLSSDVEQTAQSSTEALADDKKSTTECTSTNRRRTIRKAKVVRKTSKLSKDSELLKTVEDIKQGGSSSKVLPAFNVKDQETSSSQCENSEIGEKGVHLSISVKGGSCSTVMALVATKRLVFDIIIPDQMILIDNQYQEKEETNNLLEKVKIHELISGRKYVLPEQLGSTVDEDIYTETEEGSDGAMRNNDGTKQQMMQSNERPLIDANIEEEVDPLREEGQDRGIEISDAFSSIESTASEDHQLTSTSVECKRKLTSECDDVIPDSKRTKDSVTNTGEDELEAQSEPANREEERKKSRSQSSQSRIRMYMMREQMTETEMASSHWGACDNFFINTCEISCRLRHFPGPEIESPAASLSLEDADAFMPISHQVVADALAARKRVVLSNWTKLDPALDHWELEGKSTEFLNEVKNLYYFIEDKKEFGATATDIKEAFPFPECWPIHPMEALRDMENLKLILKVGVDTLRWITIQHSKTWLIRTIKMSRSKMNATEPVRLSGVYVVKPTDIEQEATAGTGNLNTSNADNNEVGVKSASKPGENCSIEEKGNVQNIRPRMALLNRSYRKDTESIENVEKALDIHLNTHQHEEIDVLVRPWVRLNGCLNRRVMDRMLGAILCFIMECPGVAGYKIAERFWPALQPAHTYELLETLVMLEAVSRFYVRSSHKVTLFSEPQSIYIEPAEDYDYDDSMNYEANVDCILKLAIFIGDKKYSQDFLTNCR